jgi:hypothetical protein
MRNVALAAGLKNLRVAQGHNTLGRSTLRYQAQADIKMDLKYIWCVV